MTQRGRVFPLRVACPRITTAALEPGRPEPGATYTPGALPLSRLETEGVVMSVEFAGFKVNHSPREALFTLCRIADDDKLSEGLGVLF